jgi:peptidoglycan/LPS O-acetylase OafA/YrhL
VNLFASDPRSSEEYALPGAWILLSPAVQVFPMGLICGIHFERLKRAGRWPYLAGTVLAFVASFPFAELSTLKLFTLGLSSSCLIVAVADLGEKMQSALEWTGDTSYGIYLLHFPAMMVAASAVPGGSFLQLFSVGMICGIAFGWLDRQLYFRLLRWSSFSRAYFMSLKPRS